MDSLRDKLTSEKLSDRIKKWYWIMQNEIEISQCGQTFILSASRCLFWKEQEILIISDAHFRRKHILGKMELRFLPELFNTTLYKYLG